LAGVGWNVVESGGLEHKMSTEREFSVTISSSLIDSERHMKLLSVDSSMEDMDAFIQMPSHP
jgi:hypothetical protein